MVKAGMTLALWKLLDGPMGEGCRAYSFTEKTDAIFLSLLILVKN